MPAESKQFSLLRLEADATRPAFSSGDHDIDEFFHVDSVRGCNELICVTYAFMQDSFAKAFVSVSNDAIKKESVPVSAFKRVLKAIPHEKHYRSMPATKIGRLGVASACQGEGIGTQVMDFLKIWFTSENKTGCRFLLVDAYNRPPVIKFYEKNRFRFLTGNDERDKTRIMYFDLKAFAR